MLDQIINLHPLEGESNSPHNVPFGFNHQSTQYMLFYLPLLLLMLARLSQFEPSSEAPQNGFFNRQLHCKLNPSQPAPTFCSSVFFASAE